MNPIEEALLLAEMYESLDEQHLANVYWNIASSLRDRDPK